MAAYGISGLPHHPQQLPVKDPSRPRSSPSTFGPSADSLSWTSSGLGIHGIQFTTAASHPTPPVTSTFPPNVFQTYPIDENYGTGSPPEIRQPQPRRPYTNIAPNPVGAAAKRKRDEEEQHDVPGSAGKRRKRTSSVVSADLSEDDRFLVQLKEDENLPWKDIATRFQTEKGKNFQVAALQMRYKRLREKFRVWEDQDIQALKLAHEYWEKYKWEIISAKVSKHNHLVLSNPSLTKILFHRCSTSASKNAGRHATRRVNGRNSKRHRPRRTLRPLESHLRQCHNSPALWKGPCTSPSCLCRDYMAVVTGKPNMEGINQCNRFALRERNDPTRNSGWLAIYCSIPFHSIPEHDAIPHTTLHCAALLLEVFALHIRLAALGGNASFHMGMVCLLGDCFFFFYLLR